jgi:cytochrome c oxidase subunit II
MLGLPIAPPQASSIAGQVDALALFMFLSSLLIAGAIFVCIVIFCVRYRRRPGNEIGQAAHRTAPLEVTWTLVPMALAMVPFIWGAVIYLSEAQPPPDALEIFVVAKQWMWKAQHPTGQSEIDALHVPVGRAVKLTMTSQDVIHSFFVPAFRVKADVLPGRYTTLWFQATQPGDYRLYCSQYCGTDHSDMIGMVTALSPGAYANWLTSGSTATNSPAAQGRQLFLLHGCVDCHETGRAPNLQGVFGQPVLLSDGSRVIADEGYIRESILAPAAKVVNGYQPIMPSFAGQLSEDDLVQLLAYIKSIGAPPGAGPPPPPVLSAVPGPSPSSVPSGGTTP